MMALATLPMMAMAAALPLADVTHDRYPDADSVVVDEIERVRYTPLGTYEDTGESWTKILTEKGRREESSLAVKYSKRYGTAEITYVGIIGTNGVERQVDVSATMKDATDNSSMASNIYDPLDRVINCTVPGLKIGETLHVKVFRKATKPRCEGKWADYSILEWSHPIVRSTYEVIAPKELPLRRVAVRHPLGNVVTNVTELADGSMSHVFTVTNSPQAFPEPDMPALYSEVQNVRVSTVEDWQEISRWYWELCLPRLQRTTAAMTNKVDELGRDLHAIFKFVSQEIRYMGLTMEDASPGYAPHDVDITFDNRYGVCRDKAALLVAMLRLAGFKAFPVLINVGPKRDPEIPMPFFNHAIVAVDRGDRDYELMDPTNENTKDLMPAYLGDKSYIVARPEGETLRLSPTPSPEHNSLVATSKGTLSKDGSIFLETDIDFNGINDTAYRSAFARWKPEDRVKFFERIVKRVSPGAELVKCEILPADMRDTGKPVAVHMASKLPEMVLAGETRDELVTPFVTRALGMVNFLLEGNTSLEKRRFPLSLDTTACVRETLTLDLGGNLGEVLELPTDNDGRMEGFSCTRRFSVTNGVLTAMRNAVVGAMEFSPEEYLSLREELKRAEAAARKRPVFARDALANADVRIVLDASETSIRSDREWTTTNTVIKQVLTYGGKRRSSELKFNFNPVVGSVELVSATVSNRNGKVYSVSAKEMNVMDCDWASSAPRYPAGKLLTVNLPSVEIGSVIAYTTVRTVTNAPAPFYAVFNFDSHEPLKLKSVRVNDFFREVRDPRRLPNEPLQPMAGLWRDQVVVSSNRFQRLDLRLEKCDPRGQRTIEDIRNWMAKYVKVVGPGLYELPLASQLTDAETVLRERYATRLDYVRTMCALLRGAGYEADVVLAADDADYPEALRRWIKFERPNVRAFSVALCRVKVTNGGFLGFGGEERTYFIGTENQYAPLGPSAYEGCDYFDPESGDFGIVTVPSPECSSFEAERSVYSIRENGAVDLVVENEMYGSGVGGFRRKYAEMLPENRSREYQSIIGAVAQAASATSELETDIAGYPATRKFSCYIPDFATVQGDAMTIAIPQLLSSLPSAIGNARRTPFAVVAAEPEEETVTVRFPEGYTVIEHLPVPFVLANPVDPSERWIESGVSTAVINGALEVKLTRKIHKREYAWFAPTFYEMLKDWNRTAVSRANHVIIIRKGKDK